MQSAADAGVSNDQKNQQLDLHTRQFLSRFCGYTSAHGLGRFSAQSGTVGKLIWLMFLIGTYSGFSYHLYTLLGRYYSYPVLTTITADLPYEFPDVYICPTRTVTMSTVVERFSYEVHEKLTLPFRCGIDCELELLAFDIEAGANESLVLKHAVLALSDVLTKTEASLVEEFKMLQYENASECRVTLSGEEYTGNVTTVPIYTSPFDSRRVTSNNVTEIEPYVSRKRCMAWNEAARLLLAEGVTLAGKILALEFSEDDNRCRSPPGLPLSIFFDNATHPVLTDMRCYTANNSATYSPGFHKCFSKYKAITHQLCSQCCYPRGYSHMVVKETDCFCANETGLSASLRSSGTGDCDIKCMGNSSQLCGSSNGYSVLRIRDSTPKPLHIPPGDNLTELMEGPYCFYNDSLGRLSAFYCGIPFCAAPKHVDCSPSTREGITPDPGLLVQYTGYKNVTFTGNKCLPWSQVEAMFFRQMKKTKWTSRLFLRLPDSDDGATDHNYCRVVSSAYQALLGDGASDSSSLVQEYNLGSTSVGCFYVKYLQNTQLVFETCDIPVCYAEVPSVTGVIRDSVGSIPLARQYSNDPGIGLIECSFAGKQCTRSDFLNVMHPQLGVCHYLVTDSFIKGMNSAQLANAKLSIKMFTDATDSFGRTFANMSKIAKAVHDRADLSYSPGFAFKAVVVPQGSFPKLADAIDVDSSQHIGIQLRLDKIVRLPTEGRKCETIVRPINYTLSSWYSQYNHEEDPLLQRIERTDALKILQEIDWRKKIKLLNRMLDFPLFFRVRPNYQSEMQFEFPDQQDCINRHVIQRFANICKCLPSLLPIPSEFFANYTYCFNSTDIEHLNRANICYKEQLTLLFKYEDEAISLCPAPCETRSYSIRQTAHPWPKISREQSLEFLHNLATQRGYRHKVENIRGVASLFHTYLLAKKASHIPLDNKSSIDLLKFDYQLKAVQDRLAMLTVHGWTQLGQKIMEEEAYPTKNLIADIGGCLGLWSGFSVLTVCELIELLASMALLLWAKFAARSRENYAEEKEDNDNVHTSANADTEI